MARFSFDPARINYSSLTQNGKEYNLRLLGRSQSIFTNLLGLLPSNYLSLVQGPNYTNELKAVAVELARIELALEDIDTDRSFPTTRSDFLYSIVGYLLLLNGKIPPLAFDDASFRKFLLDLVRIYFQGSIPASMADAVKLFYSGEVRIQESFLLVRRGQGGGLDISDQFAFQIEAITADGTFPPDIFEVDAAIRILLDIIRPAHTLFRVRYVFSDKYMPNSDTVNRILDTVRMKLSAYYYDDFRSYCAGIRDVDRLGHKTNHTVVGENHSDDF
jgi:hypothetical protein